MLHGDVEGEVMEYKQLARSIRLGEHHFTHPAVV